MLIFTELKKLVKLNYKVLLETSGSLTIKDVPKDVINIIDFKCPSSGMEKNNLWSIIDNLHIHDEVKFVIGNRKDYEWAKEKIEQYLANFSKRRFIARSGYNKVQKFTVENWAKFITEKVRL